jgi:hypothetical protein
MDSQPYPVTVHHFFLGTVLNCLLAIKSDGPYGGSAIGDITATFKRAQLDGKVTDGRTFRADTDHL